MTKKKRRSSYSYVEDEPEYIFNACYDLYLQPSQILCAGLGVFTRVFIPKDQLIGNYIGQIKHNNSISCGMSYSVCLNSEYYIDAFDYPRTILAMINDARFSNFTNNCVLITYSHTADIWTVKDIEMNSELFFDYGDDYWSCR